MSDLTDSSGSSSSYRLMDDIENGTKILEKVTEAAKSRVKEIEKGDEMIIHILSISFDCKVTNLLHLCIILLNLSGIIIPIITLMSNCKYVSILIISALICFLTAFFIPFARIIRDYATNNRKELLITPQRTSANYERKFIETTIKLDGVNHLYKAYYWCQSDAEVNDKVIVNEYIKVINDHYRALYPREYHNFINVWLGKDIMYDYKIYDIDEAWVAEQEHRLSKQLQHKLLWLDVLLALSSESGLKVMIILNVIFGIGYYLFYYLFNCDNELSSYPLCFMVFNLVMEGSIVYFVVSKKKAFEVIEEQSEYVQRDATFHPNVLLPGI